MSQRARVKAHNTMPMNILSPAFRAGQRMPARYTADGEDLSPPLRWSNPPPETRSLALVCEDPDAPADDFVHWLAWNIKPDQRHLNEGVSISDGMCEGQNGFGRHGYAGPNPPPGQRHHYLFHIYALDTKLDLPLDASRGQLDEAMMGHVLAEGTLAAKYEH